MTYRQSLLAMFLRKCKLYNVW